MVTVGEELVDINGARLWTARQGCGPPLVLLHGGPGLWDDFADLAAMVDDLVTVHRYDQRGSGRSKAVPPYDVATFVADLEALRMRWDHPRWIVGGHSAGANLALAYAATHPGRVSALLYFAGTGLVDDWRDEYRAMSEARRTPQQQARLAELGTLLKASPHAWTPELEHEYCALSWMADFADRGRALELARRQLRPYRVNFQLNAQLGTDWRRLLRAGQLARALREIAVPVLVLHGREDPRPARVAERLAATLPTAKLVLIPDCGHVPWLEQPHVVRREVRAFLSDITSRRSPSA